MKKLFKIVLASIFTAALFSCSNISDAGSSKKTSENANANLKILLSNGGNGSERATITSCSSIPVESITDWKFAFFEAMEKDDKIAKGKAVDYKDSTKEGSSSYEFLLSTGAYLATAEGTFVSDSDGKTHTVYGEELVLITTGEKSTATIPVGLKKSEEGTGKFNVERLNFPNELWQMITSGEISIFTLKLGSVETKEVDGETVSEKEYTFEAKWIQFDGDYIYLEKEQEIPSGYYYLEVILNGISFTPKENLVEIADGETVIVNGIEVLDATKFRTYYASKDGTGSGLTNTSKINIDSLISMLCQDKSWVSALVNVNSNFDINISEVSDFMQLERPVTFNIMQTSGYNPEIANFTLSNGKIEINNPSATLRFTGNGTINIRNPENLSHLYLSKSAKVHFVDVDSVSDYPIKFYLSEDDYAVYTETTPFATATYVSDDIGYLSLEDGNERESSPSYELTSNENHTSFYFVKLGTVDVILELGSGITEEWSDFDVSNCTWDFTVKDLEGNELDGGSDYYETSVNGVHTFAIVPGTYKIIANTYVDANGNYDYYNHQNTISGEATVTVTEESTEPVTINVDLDTTP